MHIHVLMITKKEKKKKMKYEITSKLSKLDFIFFKVVEINVKEWFIGTIVMV